MFVLGGGDIRWTAELKNNDSRRPRTMKKQKKGFTLIELLVVISIIALLVSILLPALSSAREQAKMAVCSVHLNGLGKAVVMYTLDTKDALPSLAVFRAPPDPVGDISAGQFGFDSQSFAEYHIYYESPGFRSGAGANCIGWLYMNGTLPNDTNLVFCPSFRNSNFAGYPDPVGRGVGREYDAWNPHGDPTKWNYMGVNAANAALEAGASMHMRPEDEARVGWIPARVSYGMRPIGKNPMRANKVIKKLSQGKSDMSFLSDVWADLPNYWHIHIQDLSHASKGGGEGKIHAWYLDGHVERRNFARDLYFCSPSNGSPLPDGFMNLPSNANPLTWRILFEDGVDDSTGRPYIFP
jgi:prepilin-type N-terminal cleavage/methylation domain-containing protein/prepilin-type processing-associated H-X9-DG protein